MELNDFLAFVSDMGRLLVFLYFRQTRMCHATSNESKMPVYLIYRHAIVGVVCYENQSMVILVNISLQPDFSFITV